MPGQSGLHRENLPQNNEQNNNNNKKQKKVKVDNHTGLAQNKIGRIYKHT